MEENPLSILWKSYIFLFPQSALCIGIAFSLILFLHLHLSHTYNDDIGNALRELTRISYKASNYSEPFGVSFFFRVSIFFSKVRSQYIS